MQFLTGLIVWFVFGIAAGAAIRVFYKATATDGVLTIVFGVFGAFIGGMLGMSPYIHNDPSPLRIGGLIGAALGSLFFTFVYHFTARRAI